MQGIIFSSSVFLGSIFSSALFSFLWDMSSGTTCINDIMYLLNELVAVVITCLKNAFGVSLSEENAECVPLNNCSHLNALVETKKYYYGTTFLLKLLHCKFMDGEPYVKCVNPDKIKAFMDKADLLPDYESCGLENTESKISGGEVTDIYEHPWVALLKYRNRFRRESYQCQGNLISKRYVLTAAHCVHPDVTTKVDRRILHSVVLGEYDIRNETDCIYSIFGNSCADKIKEFTVESYVLHPEYNVTTQTNDIALIRMSGDVEFTEFVSPVCFPSVYLEPTFDETLWIAGWGETENKEMNPVKVKARFRINKRESCRVNVKLTDKQFCASSKGNAKTCPGDSGGPLMMRQQVGYNYRYFLVGVDSLGVSCTSDIKVSIYTKVTSYIE